MNRTVKRVLSTLICLVMLLGMLPAEAHASNVTPGNASHGIKVSGNFYNNYSSPKTYAASVEIQDGKLVDGVDTVPNKIIVTGATYEQYYPLPTPGATYEVKLIAQSQNKYPQYECPLPDKWTYTCDIEIVNHQNYILRVILYDFGAPDSGTGEYSNRFYKKINSLKVEGNVQVILANSTIDTGEAGRWINKGFVKGTLELKNELSNPLCPASIEYNKTGTGHAQATQKPFENCSITLGKNAEVTLVDQPYKQLTFNGNEQSKATLKNFKSVGNENVNINSPCAITLVDTVLTNDWTFNKSATLTLVRTTAEGKLVFDGNNQNTAFNLSLIGATLHNDITIRNKGALTISLAGKNLLDTTYKAVQCPDIMVANDSSLTFRDDPDFADVGSLEVGQPDIDPYSGKTIGYRDGGHWTYAAIGGTPALNPLPHGVITVVSGVITAAAQYGGAAIGGSSATAAAPYIAYKKLEYTGDAAEVWTDDYTAHFADYETFYRVPGNSQFDPQLHGNYLKEYDGDPGHYYAVSLTYESSYNEWQQNYVYTDEIDKDASRPGFSPDGGTVHIYGGVVNVSANSGGAAIGGGAGGNGGEFVITGGTVNAEARMGGAAIGGGVWTFKKDKNNKYVFEGNAPVLEGGAPGTIRIIGGCVVNCKTDNNYYTFDGCPKTSMSPPRTQKECQTLDGAQEGKSLDGKGYFYTQGYVLGASARGQIPNGGEKPVKIYARNGVSPIVMLTQGVSNAYMGTGEVDAAWQNFISIGDAYIYDPIMILVGREDSENPDEGTGKVIGTHFLSDWGSNYKEIPLKSKNYNVRGQINLPGWGDEWYSAEKNSEVTLPEQVTLTLLSGTVMNVASGFRFRSEDGQLAVEDGAVIQGRGIWPGKPAISPDDDPNPDETKALLDYLKEEAEKQHMQSPASHIGSNSTGSRAIVTHLGIVKTPDGDRYIVPGDSSDEIEASLPDGWELVTAINAGYCGFIYDAQDELWRLLISNKSTSISLTDNGALRVSPSSSINALSAVIKEDKGAVVITAKNAKLASPDYTVFHSKTGKDLELVFSPEDDDAEINDDLAFRLELDASDNKAVFSVPNFLGSSFSLDSVAPLKNKCALRYGGELNFTTPFAEFAGVNITQLQINYGGGIALGGIAGGGKVEVPEFGGFPVSGSAEMNINTFGGEQEYSLSVELETPIFEGAFEASFKEVRGVVLPDTLYAELGIDEGGIPLVPPTIIGYIQGAGLGFEGLADTVNMDSFGAPPIRLKMAAKGSLFDVINGWVRLSVGPSGFDLSMTDIEIKGLELIKEYGLSASWDAGRRTIKGIDYWGMSADIHQYLEIALGYNDNDIVTARGTVGYGGFTGYKVLDKKADVIIQFEGYGSLYGSIQVPSCLVGPLPPFDINLANAEVAFYTAIGARNIIDMSKISADKSAANILRQLVTNIRPYFRAAVGAKVVAGGSFIIPECHVKVTYVFGDKKVGFSAGTGDGGELDLRSLVASAPSQTYTTLMMIEDTETGEEVPAIVEVGMVTASSLQLEGDEDVAELAAAADTDGDDDIVLHYHSADDGEATLFDSAVSSFEAEVKNIGTSLISIQSVNKEQLLDSSNLTVTCGGKNIPLVQAVYTKDESGLPVLTNPDKANFFEGTGTAYFAAPSVGTFVISSTVALEKAQVIKVIDDFATLDTASASGYEISNADAARRYKVQLFLGETEGSTDYLIEEQELDGETGYSGSFADLSGTAAPDGSYYPTVVLLEYMTATDDSGETVETWSPLDRKVITSRKTYTNETTPDAPTVSYFEYSGNGTMTAGWSKVEGADSYQITVYDAAGNDTGSVFLVNSGENGEAPANSLVMDFTSFEPGSYKIGVKAQIAQKVDGFTTLVSSPEGMSAAGTLKEAAKIDLGFGEGVVQGENNLHSFTVHGKADASFTVTSDKPLAFTVTNDATGEVLVAQTNKTSITVNIPAEDDSLNNAKLLIVANDETTKDFAVQYVMVNRDDSESTLTLDNLGIFPLTKTDAGYVASITGHAKSGATVVVWEQKYDVTKKPERYDAPTFELVMKAVSNGRVNEDGSFSVSLNIDAEPSSAAPPSLDGWDDLDESEQVELYQKYINYRKFFVRVKDETGNWTDSVMIGFPEDTGDMVKVNFDANGGINAYCATSGVALQNNTVIGALPTAYWVGDEDEALMLFDGWYTEPVGGERIAEGTLITKPEKAVLTASLFESEDPEEPATPELSSDDDGSVTVYAHWVPGVNLSFDAESAGASCDVSEMLVKSGREVGELPVPELNTPSDDLMFVGWCMPDGTVVTEKTTFSRDTRLTPRWSEFVTVTFDAGIGSCGLDSIKVEKGGKIASYPKTSARGYTCEGWYMVETDDSDPKSIKTRTIEVTQGTTYSEDVTIIARWSRNTAPLSVSQTGCSVGDTLSDPVYELPAGVTVVGKPNITYTRRERVFNPDTEELEDTVVYQSSAKPTDAGSYIVTVQCDTFDTAYVGTATFGITASSITGAQISEIPAMDYTGKALTPDFTVTLNGSLLTKGVDYTVGYQDNTDAGNATVMVYGKNNYSGTLTTGFTILPISLAGASLGAIEDQPYTGEEITPEVTVTLGGKTLVKDTDYTLSYNNNTNAGTATVTVTGKNNYSGETGTVFNITADGFTSAQISAIADQIYTGSALTPDFTVTLSGNTLKKDTDYTVEYKDNTEPGTATVTITGMGDYSGEKSVTFNIIGVVGKWDGTLKATACVPRTSFLIAAVYDKDGRQVSVKIISAKKDNTSYDTGLTKTEGYSYKLLLVNKDTFAPLCAAWNSTN